LKTSSGVASKSAQQPLTKQAERPDQGRQPIDNEAGAESQLNGIGSAARQSLRLAFGLDHRGRDDRLSGLVAGLLVGDAYLFCLCVLTLASDLRFNSLHRKLVPPKWTNERNRNHRDLPTPHT
jgi:hypothetical protein